MSSYPARRSPRLRDFDYAQPGAYFVTLCIERRLCLLGQIVEAEMRLCPAGEMVGTVWGNLGRYYYPGKLWQHGFFDHVIRNERELAAIREYIVNNPMRWHLDRENPNFGR